MPCSIAACRTVLPFATVTCWPSIVNVTVSIRSGSYQACTDGRRRRLTTRRRTPRFSSLAMDATRARLSLDRDQFVAHTPWIATVAVALTVLLLGALVVREVRSAPRPAGDATSVSASAAVVPAEAVSVPALVLRGGREIHV